MEILQTIKTFMYRQDSETELAKGEEKEFLRGTFSMMDIGSNSQESLDVLKARFLNCQKEIGGLEVDEFETALRPFISKGVSDSHIRTLFRKMDTTEQGAVSWEEFINFAITEHTMRKTMHETMDEMPFGKEVPNIKHHHKDVITSIDFMPNINLNARTIDWKYGRYMVLSRDGTMSIWSLALTNMSYNNLVVENYRDSSWFLDMACFYHNGYVATISTGRDLALYDYTKRGWMRKYHIRNFDNCPCTLSYWASLKSEMAIVVLGDTSGSVILIEFDLSNLNPLFGLAIREGCYSLSWREIMLGKCGGTIARVYANVHNDWVKQVQYVPELNSVFSCCMDDDTGMYLTYTEPKKKTPAYFNTIRGILCFDYSHALNVLVCAGIDCAILLFNPYLPKKLVAAKEAHIRPVVKLRINEIERYSVSVDMSKTIIIFSLVNQCIQQRIPGQSVHLGVYPINCIYLHSERRILLLGAHNMAMVKRHKLEDTIVVDVRSHDFKLVGALYSSEFEQVVSVCRGSMVRVWDLNTGTRVMQFPRAHEKKLQGEWVPVEIECITLSENGRRLFTGAEGVVKIWNFNTGSVLRTIDMSNCSKITSIVMAKQQIYITGWHKVINVFSDFKGEEAVKKTWASSHLSDCLNLSIMEPNMIASCSYDGSIILWSRESTYDYCKLHATFGPKPELSTGVRSGGNKSNIMHVAADLEAESDEEEEGGEDSFMTIGTHLRKEGGWYKLLRALKKRQIEREKRRAAKERKDFTARYKKKKKRMNMQGLSLIYESAVECIVFLGNRRLIDPHTATLVASGAECWIRFWSIHPRGGLLAQFNASRRKLESVRCMTTDKDNEVLLTGDTLGFMRIFDIKEFCNADKLTQEERDSREHRLRQEYVYLNLPFKPEQMLDTMERLREKKISVPDASKPRKNLKAPRLLSSIRAHTMAITSLQLIEERNVILTSSQDLTVRLWTKNCTHIGTFGETWKPLPKRVARVVERPPRIPRDVLRVASAHSLATLHNGKMPHWRNACYLVRRHIYELRKEKQIEEARQKMKEEKRARGEPDSDDEESLVGEKPVSKILGKTYKPKKCFLGPINLKDQGLPELRVFRGKCAPYHSTKPRNLTCMVPLFEPRTFFEIDARRTGALKMRRSTRLMMNQFNTIACNPTRFGARSAASALSVSTAHSHMNERQTGDFVSQDKSFNKPEDDTEKAVLNYRYGKHNRIYQSLQNLPGVSRRESTAEPVRKPTRTTNAGRFTSANPGTKRSLNVAFKNKPTANLHSETKHETDGGTTSEFSYSNQPSRLILKKTSQGKLRAKPPGGKKSKTSKVLDENMNKKEPSTVDVTKRNEDVCDEDDAEEEESLEGIRRIVGNLENCDNKIEDDWNAICNLTPAEYFGLDKYECSDSEQSENVSDEEERYYFLKDSDAGCSRRPKGGEEGGTFFAERIDADDDKHDNDIESNSDIMNYIYMENINSSLPQIATKSDVGQASTSRKTVKFSHLLK